MKQLNLIAAIGACLLASTFTVIAKPLPAVAVPASPVVTIDLRPALTPTLRAEGTVGPNSWCGYWPCPVVLDPDGRIVFDPSDPLEISGLGDVIIDWFRRSQSTWGA